MKFDLIMTGGNPPPLVPGNEGAGTVTGVTAPCGATATAGTTAAAAMTVAAGMTARCAANALSAAPGNVVSVFDNVAPTLAVAPAAVAAGLANPQKFA